MKTIAPGATDQTLTVWCYDEDGEPVALTHASAGLTLHYQRDSSGRGATPVSMTPVARSGPGVHTDGAITHIGDGEHAIDLPDEACESGAEGVSVVLVADGVTDAIAERAALQLTPAAALTAYDAATGADVTTAVSGIAIGPYSSHAPQRVVGTTVTGFLGEDGVDLSITCYDAAKALLTITGKTLKYAIALYSAPKTPIFVSDEFTGSGTAFDLTLDSEFTDNLQLDGEALLWTLWEGTEVIQWGRLVIKPAAPTVAIS